jgi:hypothetical protein
VINEYELFEPKKQEFRRISSDNIPPAWRAADVLRLQVNKGFALFVQPINGGFPKWW